MQQCICVHLWISKTIDFVSWSHDRRICICRYMYVKLFKCLSHKYYIAISTMRKFNVKLTWSTRFVLRFLSLETIYLMIEQFRLLRRLGRSWNKILGFTLVRYNEWYRVVRICFIVVSWSFGNKIRKRLVYSSWDDQHF